jgi:hypothetical protein
VVVVETKTKLENASGEVVFELVRSFGFRHQMFSDERRWCCVRWLTGMFLSVEYFSLLLGRMRRCIAGLMVVVRVDHIVQDLVHARLVLQVEHVVRLQRIGMNASTNTCLGTERWITDEIEHDAQP